MKKHVITAESILREGPVLPVIVIKDIEKAVPMAKSLLAGGIRAMEITLRTKYAIEAIHLISREVPEAIVGAGTVINSQQLHDVASAGAQFAISPGINRALLQSVCDIPFIPGISTASEIMLGINHGLHTFKFFPAEANGGVETLKAISGPFPQASFCPTGGITISNCRPYLALDNVLCVGGSWLVPQEALEKNDYKQITRLAKEVIENCCRQPTSM